MEWGQETAPTAGSARLGESAKCLVPVHGKVLNGGLDLGEAMMEDDRQRRLVSLPHGVGSCGLSAYVAGNTILLDGGYCA